jgi:hypothetical protein
MIIFLHMQRQKQKRPGKPGVTSGMRENLTKRVHVPMHQSMAWRE